jgi:hypothetical protein
VEKGKVRYIHSRGNPRTDHFTFTAALNGAASGKAFTFTITFVNINIQPTRNQGLTLDNVVESVITEASLMYQTYPEPTEDARYVQTPGGKGAFCVLVFICSFSLVYHLFFFRNIFSSSIICSRYSLFPSFLCSSISSFAIDFLCYIY